MIFPDERVVEVARLGPIKASELLEKGRAGDLGALADWSVYSMFREFVRLGASPSAAIAHTRSFLREVNLVARVAI